MSRWSAGSWPAGNVLANNRRRDALRLRAELKAEVVARQPVALPARVCSPRPRRIAIAAIGVSAAVAVGLVVVTTGTPTGTPAVRYSLAADFLNHAAAAARAQDAPLPRPEHAPH